MYPTIASPSSRPMLPGNHAHGGTHIHSRMGHQSSPQLSFPSPRSQAVASDAAVDAVCRAPGSQQSAASVSPGHPALLRSSSSNASAATDPGTGQTSPASSLGATRELQQYGETRILTTRLSDADTASRGLSRTSPPLASAAKRTASGTVKTLLDAVPPASPAQRHARHASYASQSTHISQASQESSTSRIGEIAAQLRSRLSYAAVKVQNGWERSSIEEIEEGMSQPGSSLVATPRRHGSSTQPSPQSDRQAMRRRVSVSESAPPRSATAAHVRAGAPLRRTNTQRAAGVHFAPGLAEGRGLGITRDRDPALGDASSRADARAAASPLAPAANIVSRPVYRRSGSSSSSSGVFVVPSLKQTSSAPANILPLAGSPLQTQYQSPRVLQMPSQQAEKDAIDTLMFLRSPRTATRTRRESEALPSPFQTEFRTRMSFADETPQTEPARTAEAGADWGLPTPVDGSCRRGDARSEASEMRSGLLQQA